MISKNFFNIFNYASLGAVILIVVLMYIQVIQPQSFLYALIFALLLFISRIVIRLLYIKQNKKDINGG
jgi:FlaA1/EpsC-like NDP-sugar epimerase